MARRRGLGELRAVHRLQVKMLEIRIGKPLRTCQWLRVHELELIAPSQCSRRASFRTDADPVKPLGSGKSPVGLYSDQKVAGV